MRFFSALLKRKGAEEERYNVGLEDLLQQYLGYGGFAYGLGGSTGNVEAIENSFAGYVAGAYKSGGVVFASMVSRMSIFSEAVFGFQARSARLGERLDVEHPELDILEKPWPNGTTGELLSRMVQDADLAGNFYAVRQGRRLRRLRPDWVQIILTGDPMVEADVDVVGYLYRPGGNLGATSPIVYLPHEVVHWSPIPDPDAHYRGMSWLTPVLREIQADKYATEHKVKFFTNGAALKAIVSMKETVTEQQFKKFSQLIAEGHQGVDNAYKTLLVAGGADVRVVGADLKQIDFKAVTGAGETRVAAAAGMHPVIVGLSEGLSGSSLNAGNFASARRLTADKTMRPLWRSAAAALANVIKVPAGKRLRVDDAQIAFLREDRADQATIRARDAQTLRNLLDSGWDPNSAVAAIVNGDWTDLVHTGRLSVQLQKPDDNDGDDLDPVDEPLPGDEPDDTDDSPDGGADGNPA